MILLINTILWWSSLRSSHLNAGVIQTSLFGSTLLMGFFMVFLLSTKARPIVRVFGGLEHLYWWHRLLAITTTAMILLHAEWAVDNDGSGWLANLFGSEADDAGELAQSGFLILVGLALLAKFFRYEHFRFLHRLMVVPYVIALYHSFALSWADLFAFDALSIWMIATSLVGVGSAAYMLFAYRFTAFPHKGTIVQADHLTDDVTELKVRMNRPYQMKAGQFAFLQVRGHNRSHEIHPFSISGQEDGCLLFTIKSLGDYTSTLNQQPTLAGIVRVSHPYGDLTFDAPRSDQVWIAGGIGITPFLGALRSNWTPSGTIHLVYSVQHEQDAVHLGFLQRYELDHDWFQFTLHVTSEQGFLTGDALTLTNDTAVYLCGPTPMVHALRRQIHALDPELPIHSEAFQFTGHLVDDAWRLVKSLWRQVQTKR
jgi:predicted ferric reductase